jgi:hypothetical protein
MDSLQDILGANRLAPPDEMIAIKAYIKRRYKSPCQVKLQRDALIVSVSNSALAATIYLERQALIDSCNLTKKLVVRTG